MNDISVVLVHIGKNIPVYIYDCIYQLKLVDNNKLYILLENSVIEEFRLKISKLKIENKNNICCIPIEVIKNYLDRDEQYIKYKEWINKFNNEEFRDGFWISTTERFYYIYEFMKIFKIRDVFHIENDIMMYTSFNDIYKNMKEYNKIWVVKDHPKRVIPSIMYFPTSDIFYNILKKISIQFGNTFINDMILWGNLSTDDINLFPNELKQNVEYFFDGAAIGQYLGGIDSRNNGGNTKGFINETSIFRADLCIYTKVKTDNNLKIYCMKYKNTFRGIPNRFTKIANLHIHSKRLYEFSSEFTYNQSEIISGERLFSLCDFVICTKQIWDFHKNLKLYAKDVIIVNDFNNIDGSKLNIFCDDVYKKTNNKIIKLGIYTHILGNFRDKVLDKLSDKYKYVLYTHNSDHHFDLNYSELVNNSKIEHIFCQNIDYPIENSKNKLTLLPIGIANSMWKHGDINQLYKIMTETYLYKKTKNIYININPDTFTYRREILEIIKKNNKFNISTNKPYEEYIKELSSYRFVLCLRGNGVDTHRFWEALYLLAVPVIINNKYTRMDNYVKYLKDLNIPFYEIKEESFNKYSDNFFNEELYEKFLPRIKCSLNELTLSYYDKY